MHHNLRRDTQMGRNIRVTAPLTAREMAAMDAELDQEDMYGPKLASDAHLDDLDMGGYEDASRTELQAGGEQLSGGARRPATVQVAHRTSLRNQILCSHRDAAERLPVVETPVNYMGMPT